MSTTRTNPARTGEMVLERIERLPTLSPVATKLLSIAGDDDAQLDEIVPLIESDPALAAALLGLCRRAETGLGDRITTVRRAIVMLGLETVQSLVLGVAVFGLVSEQQAANAQDDGVFDHAGMWKHLIATACGAELIARNFDHLGIKPGEAFVGGLLHDLGTLALDVALPGAYGQVLHAAESRRSAIGPIARRVIGLDPHTAGRRLADRWGLPEGVRDVVWLCAQPWASLPETDSRALIGLVTLAEAWARHQHIGWSGEFNEPPALSALCEPLGVNPKTLDDMLGELVAEVSARSALLGLDDQSGDELLIESLGRANQRLGDLNVSLGGKARQAGRLGRVLDAATNFHAACADAATIDDALGCVVRSATGAIGSAQWWALVRAQGDEPWRVLRFDADGRVLGQNEVSPPAGSNTAQPLGGTGMGDFSLGSLGALAWVGAELGEHIDLNTIRAVPLCAGGSGEPFALLLHDHGKPPMTRDEMAALVSVWSGGVSGVARREQTVRLNDQLVETNRSLIEAQQQLLENESLARLGELAAGAAHEMNNPLTVIRGRGQMLAESLETSRDRAAAAAIAEAADDLSNLISSLRLLSDPPEAHPEPTDPRLIVRLAIDLARQQLGQLGDSVQVRVEIDETAREMCLVDLELVARGIGELIVNGVEASNGAPIRIVVQPDPLGGRWSVQVIDTGPGLTDRAMRHAFDPFFSEKPAGRQTGLGLARARGLIEHCGGEVTLANTGFGRGATATVRLPSEWAQSEPGRKAA